MLATLAAGVLIGNTGNLCAITDRGTKLSRSLPDILLGLHQTIYDLSSDIKRRTDCMVLTHRTRLIEEDATQILNGKGRKRVIRLVRGLSDALSSQGV